MPKSDLDFTLSNARRFYSSKGGPLDTKGLRPFNDSGKSPNKTVMSTAITCEMYVLCGNSMYYATFK